ncbi:MAG: hypothetical protein ICV68_15720 [Pyrinomonadaceae bacterium]|nr:hypothetical protein [Pyrinomonadaceae bacterium]
MKSIVGGRRRFGLWFQVVGVVIVAAGSALSWLAWLGWDHQYQLDPVTGVWSGPYEAWQVMGCALSLVVLFVGALLAGVRPLPASAALTLAFTAAWTAEAAPGDDTGMYGVGMFILLVGLGIGTTVVSVVTLGLRDRWLARRS